MGQRLRVNDIAGFWKRSNNRLEDQMVAYEFYCLDSKGQWEVIGVLPERRQNPERLTEESITHWGKEFFRNLNVRDIFFIQVTIDDKTGRISRPTPLSIPWRNAGKS